MSDPGLGSVPHSLTERSLTFRASGYSYPEIAIAAPLPGPELGPLSIPRHALQSLESFDWLEKLGEISFPEKIPFPVYATKRLSSIMPARSASAFEGWNISLRGLFLLVGWLKGGI